MDFNSALAHSDGLCVLECMFEVTFNHFNAFFNKLENYQRGDQHNDNYNGFAKILPQIIHPGTGANFSVAPALRHLMPHDLTQYFTYNGSLTTPPCSEVVTWIDFKNPVKLSQDQVIY